MIFENQLESQHTSKLESLVCILDTVNEHKRGIVFPEQVSTVTKAPSLLRGLLVVDSRVIVVCLGVFNFFHENFTNFDIL